MKVHKDNYFKFIHEYFTPIDTKIQIENDNKLLAKLKNLKWSPEVIKLNLKNFQYHYAEFCKKSNLTVNDFKKVFDSAQARNAKDIIYIFMAKEKVPRLRGESRIVYIGQTKRSLHARHSSTSRIKSESEANKAKYNHIIKDYKEITVYYLSHIEYAPDISLLKLEGLFLWWYFQNHLEYPPLNYTKTKTRTSVYNFLTPQTNKSNQETK